MDIDLFTPDTEGNLSLKVDEGAEPRFQHSTNDWNRHYFDSPQTYESLIAFVRGLADKRAAVNEQRRSARVREWLALPDDKDKVGRLAEDGTIDTYGYTTVEPTHLEYEAVLAEHKRRAEVKRQRDQQAEEQRQNKITEFWQKYIDGDELEVSADDKGLYSYKAHSSVARLSSDHPLYRPVLAEMERREQEAEAKAQAEVEYIAAWVNEHGIESEKERLAEGLLPRKEVFERIKAHIFGDSERFDWRNRKPGCTCEYETCGVDHEVEDATELSADQYEQLKALRADFPNAEIAPRKHIITRKECDERAVVITARVKIQAGPFTFTRSFEL